MHTTTERQLVDRVRNLEQSNARTRRLATATALSLALVALIALTPSEDDVIEAQRFTVVDDDGVQRAVFGIFDGSPLLVMFDEAGSQATVGLIKTDEDRGVFVWDENGEIRAFMGRYDSPRFGMAVLESGERTVWQEMAGPANVNFPHVRVMRADLRNLVTAQESYFADNLRYTSDFAALDMSTSDGVTIEIISASSKGWHALARHERTNITCQIYLGAPVAQIGPEDEGRPVCTER